MNVYPHTHNQDTLHTPLQMQPSHSPPESTTPGKSFLTPPHQPSFYFNTSLSTSQRWCGTEANSCNTHSQENKDPTSDWLLDTEAQCVSLSFSHNHATLPLKQGRGSVTPHAWPFFFYWQRTHFRHIYKPPFLFIYEATVYWYLIV